MIWKFFTVYYPMEISQLKVKIIHLNKHSKIPFYRDLNVTYVTLLRNQKEGSRHINQENIGHMNGVI